MGTALNSTNRNRLHLTLISAFMFFVGAVKADILIDDFKTTQDVFNGSTGPINITSGTQLTGLTRTLIATSSASPSNAKTSIDIQDGYLDIANSFGSSGTVSIEYSFSGVDLAATARSFLLDVDFVDSSPEIQLIANGSSVFDFVVIGLGLFEIQFTQFSNPFAFSNLTSLQLNLMGPSNWDASFKSLSAESNNVPEPSILSLLLLGLAASVRDKFYRVVVKRGQA